MADPQRVRSVFLEAVERHGPDQLGPFLDRACGGDRELRDRVEVLLRAHDQANSLLDVSASLPAPITDQASAAAPSAVIGPYKLVESIGEGGMGTVWVARQTQPVKRLVALKLIRAGMDSKQVLARFDAERQALALMDHPNIARVFDAGATADGRPYFVMELVKGVPITAYCDDHHLSPIDRLGLFMQVCSAVQHAHQKGIIHRDIKPSNVLVAPYDGVPVVKVIDFGVAKAVGQTLTEKTLVTNFGAVVGTPEYMSPEQAEMNNHDIDTRSDIYSVGVLLYELSTGTTPLTHLRVKETALLEVLRVIREEEPPRPSTRLAESKETLPAVSEKRRTEPAKLTRLVRGELDWIVMKALEKDRNRRYETADSLSRDIRRYLADDPVQACPPSTWYRLSKLGRRHSVALTTTALISAVLVLGTLVSLWQAVRAREAEGLAEMRERSEMKQREATRHQLFEAFLAQAKAIRHTRQAGQRLESWKAVSEAGTLARELELGEDRIRALRDEAIASLALTDVQLIDEWELTPTIGELRVYDSHLQFYACLDAEGAIAIRRVIHDELVSALRGSAPADAESRLPRMMQFSPDGRLLAVRSTSLRRVRIWDWQRNQSLFDESVPAPIQTMAFSPDGQRLALGQNDGTLLVIDTATGHPVTGPLQLGSMPTHICYSPDGTRLAVSSSLSEHVQIRDQRGEETRRIRAPGGATTTAWHPNGVLLAVGCNDRTVHLWDHDSSQVAAVLRGHQAPPEMIGFAAGGDFILSWSWDGNVRLWDTWAGDDLVRFAGRALQFSSDGRRILSSNGGKFALWEVVSSRELRTLPCQRKLIGESIKYGGVSRDNRFLAIGTTTGMRLWDLAAGKELTVPFFPTYDVRFLPNKEELITAGSFGLYRWPMQCEGGQLRIGPGRRLPMPGSLGLISVDQTGRMVTAIDRRGLGGWALDLEGSTPARALPHGNATIVATGHDGRWGATATHHGLGVKLWDLRTGEELLRHPLIPGDSGTTAEFSPDGRWLATGTPDEFRIWKTGSWELVRPIRRDQALYNIGTAFSSDSRVLALTLSLSSIQLRDPSGEQVWAQLDSPLLGPISFMTFSPDGSQLIIVDWTHNVRVWDLRRIRERLNEIALDWDLPPYSDANPGNVAPVSVVLDPGDLGKDATSVPDDAGSCNNLAWHLATSPEPSLRDAQRALRLARQATDREPQNGTYWNTLGVAQFRNGQLEFAIQSLEKSMSLRTGGDGYDFFFMALSHERLGRHEEALRWHHRAIDWMDRNDPANEELRRIRVEASERVGRSEKDD